MVLVNDSEESRRVLETCYKRHKTVLNPIIDWEDRDVWDFIRSENIPYCSGYDKGFCRMGCILCPLASLADKMREAAMYPKYKDQYMGMIAKMEQEREALGMKRPIPWGKTTEDIYNWWIGNGVLPDQTKMQIQDE